jgi:zinc transporter ZupT
MDAIVLILAASGTALATGLGAVPVFLLGPRARELAPALLGFAAGVMAVAAIVGLLIPRRKKGRPTRLSVGWS